MGIDNLKKKASKYGGLVALTGAAALSTGCATVGQRDTGRDNMYAMVAACEDVTGENQQKCGNAVDIIQEMVENKQYDELQARAKYSTLDTEEEKEQWIVNYLNHKGMAPQTLTGHMLRYGEEVASGNIDSEYNSAYLRDLSSAAVLTTILSYETSNNVSNGSKQTTTDQTYGPGGDTGVGGPGAQ